MRLSNGRADTLLIGIFLAAVIAAGLCVVALALGVVTKGPRPPQGHPHRHPAPISARPTY